MAGAGLFQRETPDAQGLRVGRDRGSLRQGVFTLQADGANEFSLLLRVKPLDAKQDHGGPALSALCKMCVEIMIQSDADAVGSSSRLEDFSISRIQDQSAKRAMRQYPIDRGSGLREAPSLDRGEF